MLRLFNVVGAVVALGAAFVFAAAPSSAQVLDGSSPEEVMAVMEDYGLNVDIEYPEESEGPVLNSATENFMFQVSFEACDDDGTGCELIVFRCGFGFEPEDRPDLETLNSWNSELWGKAYMDENGNPWVALEVNIVGGITEDNMMDTLTWWDGMMFEFADFIGYEF